MKMKMLKPGNTKEGSITVLLTSCLTSLDQSVLQIKTKIVRHHTADSKPVKQEVNGTVMFPSLVFPAQTFKNCVPARARTHVFVDWNVVAIPYSKNEAKLKS
jgi:hypothetical protein